MAREDFLEVVKAAITEFFYTAEEVGEIEQKGFG